MTAIKRLISECASLQVQYGIGKGAHASRYNGGGGGNNRNIGSSSSNSKAPISAQQHRFAQEKGYAGKRYEEQSQRHMNNIGAQHYNHQRAIEGSTAGQGKENSSDEKPMASRESGSSAYAQKDMSSDRIIVDMKVTAPDKDKVYRWLIGRNGTNIKLMQSTGVSIQVDAVGGRSCPRWKSAKRHSAPHGRYSVSERGVRWKK